MSLDTSIATRPKIALRSLSARRPCRYGRIVLSASLLFAATAIAGKPPIKLADCKNGWPAIASGWSISNNGLYVSYSIQEANGLENTGNLFVLESTDGHWRREIHAS